MATVNALEDIPRRRDGRCALCGWYHEPRCPVCGSSWEACRCDYSDAEVRRRARSAEAAGPVPLREQAPE